MKLDYYETNILRCVLYDFEKEQKTKYNKTNLITVLYKTKTNTNNSLTTLRSALNSLTKKIEKLSEKELEQILIDRQNDKILPSVCYELPCETELLV